MTTKREKAHKLLNEALERLSGPKVFPSDYQETIVEGKLRGKDSKVYLRNTGGWIELFVYVKGIREGYTSSPYTIAVLDPLTGWKQSGRCNRTTFNSWHSKECNKIAQLEAKRRL